METEIKEALIQLLGAIKRSDSAAIVENTVRLDGLAGAHRAQLHPQLAHFLERRSYAKALMFLGGESDIPSGACR